MLLCLVASAVLGTQSGGPPTWQLAAAGSVECAVLYALLRPTSYHYHAGRALLALLVALASVTYWATKAPLVATAAYLVHLLWLMGLTVTLCALLGYSLWQRLQARRDG